MKTNFYVTWERMNSKGSFVQGLMIQLGFCTLQSPGYLLWRQKKCQMNSESRNQCDHENRPTVKESLLKNGARGAQSITSIALVLHGIPLLLSQRWQPPNVFWWLVLSARYLTWFIKGPWSSDWKSDQLVLRFLHSRTVHLKEHYCII